MRQSQNFQNSTPNQPLSFRDTHRISQMSTLISLAELTDLFFRGPNTESSLVWHSHRRSTSDQSSLPPSVLECVQKNAIPYPHGSLWIPTNASCNNAER
ncbi:hypothetical protein TNCV_3272471 [Trichonephila clavipes]|nr:hypothetical protein TNCV_3272471 [Trichonephila clavipes]